MKLPEIDLEDLKRDKERNFKERLEFVERYAKWVMESSNKKWSGEQKKLIG